MSERQTKRLDELYSFSSGLSKPRSEFGLGNPFLSFKDVFNNIFVPKRLESLVRSDERERTVFSIERGDVFLTRTSETINELGMSSVALNNYPDATFNGFTKRLRPRPGVRIIPEYAGYFFRSDLFRQAVNSMAIMSTRASLNNEMLARLSMVLPPVDDQEAIGFTLRSLDDKIELNRRMNETLETMARTIFKDWFVDFGPTRAKAEGRAPYLAPEIWSLFPSRLDDQGKPEGWRNLTLGDITLRITKGSTPTSRDISSASLPNSQVNFVRVNALANDGSILWEKLERIPESIHLGSLKRSILQNNDIIYSIAGTIGRISLVDSALLPANTNQALAIIRPNKDLVPARFLLALLRQQEFSSSLHENIVHAVQANLSLSMIAAAKCVLPPAALLPEMAEAVDLLTRRQEQNIHESRALTQTRDYLLPKLMSGEIRIREAEKLVAAAV